MAPIMLDAGGVIELSEERAADAAAAQVFPDGLTALLDTAQKHVELAPGLGSKQEHCPGQQREDQHPGEREAEAVGQRREPVERTRQEAQQHRQKHRGKSQKHRHVQAPDEVSRRGYTECRADPGCEDGLTRQWASLLG